MNRQLNNLVQTSIANLYKKLSAIDLNALNISEYNKNYLSNYIENYSFYMGLYAQLLKKAIKKLKLPISESTFVDYGGGSGILTYLASEIGFKKIVYNDIYEVSISDVKIISEALKFEIDYFINGNAELFAQEINKLGITPDLICSVDVLEHIYNLEDWFEKIAHINNNFSLLFMTSANSKNPFIVNRLKKIHRIAEYKGSEIKTGWKERDLKTSFLSARMKIIKTHFPLINDQDLDLLSSKSRGLKKDDIIRLVNHYMDTNEIIYNINHPTNTCDPYTGNWTENLIDLKKLKNTIEKFGFRVRFTNSFYSYSKNKLLNIPKTLLNLMIMILGTKHLLLSPTYTLEIEKS